MPDLDPFELSILGELAARPYVPDRVDPVLRAKFRNAGLIDLEDRKPGKPNYTRGKWVVVVTLAGHAILAEGKSAASVQHDQRQGPTI